MKSTKLFTALVLWPKNFTRRHCQAALSDPPRDRFDRVVLDPVAEERESYLKRLRKLVAKVKELDTEADNEFIAWRDHHFNHGERETTFRKLDGKLQKLFADFSFKQMVVEMRWWRKTSTQYQIQFARVGGNGRAARIQRATASERAKKAEDAGAGVTCPDAAPGFPDGVQPSPPIFNESAAGQNGDGGGEFAPCHRHRQKIQEPRAVVPGFDPGRQHRVDEGGGKIRVSPRL